MPVINISNNKVQYKFEIHGKYTLIKGDSGIGKTTLYELVRLLDKANGSIVLQSTHKVRVLPTDYAEIPKEVFTDSVIFIDEADNILRQHGYEKWLREINAYFVFISRTIEMRNLPISVDSVFTIKRSGKLHTLVPMVSRFTKQELHGVDIIITEDSNSGKQFLQQVANYAHSDVLISSAGGNTNIVRCVRQAFQNNKNVVVVYDAAAMGACVLDLLNVIQLYKNCHCFVIDWESFEHYILASPAFNRRYTLAEVGYKAESLEQFSTIMLTKLLSKGYIKEKLPLCLTVSGCGRCYSKCAFPIYKFNQLIYDKVETLYVYLAKNKVQSIENEKQESGAYRQNGGMVYTQRAASRLPVTYELYMREARAAKKGVPKEQQNRIKSVSFEKGTCVVIIDTQYKVVKIQDLVGKVLNHSIVLSNPYMLSGWKHFGK